MPKKSGQWYKDVAVILLNTLLLFLMLEAGATVALRFRLPADDRRVQDAPSYYKNQEWGAGYLRESRRVDDVHYVPYVMWKTDPFEGQYVRIDKEGNRVTPGAACGAGSYNVFMFGGSAMWGAGVPDWGTVPAYVQAELVTTHNTPLCVRNFGQPGWVSTQNVVELLRHLQAGEVPDLVVFYDGVNEVGVLWEDGAAGGHYRMGQMKSRLQQHGIRRTAIELLVWTHLFQLVEQFAPSVSTLRDWPERYALPKVDNATGATIVRTYLSNYSTVGALAAGYGFQYALFWQPTLHYTRNTLTSEERHLVEAEDRPGMAELVKLAYDQVRAEARNPGHLFFIADIFENVTEPVYLDAVHLTPVGNQKVARLTLMLERLRTP